MWTETEATEAGAVTRVSTVGFTGCAGAFTGTGNVTVFGGTVTDSSLTDTVMDTVVADAGTADTVAQVVLGKDPLAPETPETATGDDTGAADGPRAG